MRRFAIVLRIGRKWGMSVIGAAFACALSGCCTSDKCVAITASNMMHDAGIAAAESIRIGCTERYKSADTLDKIAALDAPCLPASQAYSDFAKAQAILESVLTAVLAGASSTAIAASLATAKSAALALSSTLGKVPK